ncbi:hypothetical protein ACKAV7_005584 [Fusarium commune]
MLSPFCYTAHSSRKVTFAATPTRPPSAAVKKHASKRSHDPEARPSIPRIFTLRRAPFLLSYAVYSAVIVILRQERHERGQFTEPISFFWTCLSELQVGCNFGLKKPLSVLQDMVREFQTSIKESGSTGTEQPQPAGLDESFFFPLAMAPAASAIAPNNHNTSTPTGAYVSANASDYIPHMDHFDPAFGHSPAC